MKANIKSRSNKLPRQGTVLYNLVHPDEKIRQKTLRKFRRLNKFIVIPLYRSFILPLLGFGRIFLILTTIGRISGKKRRTPLEYHWIEGIMTVFSGRGEESGWLKNIRVNPQSVWVRHGFHAYPIEAKLVTNELEQLKIVRWYVVNHSRSAKMLFGWDKWIDDPETTDLSNLNNSISIIQLFRKEV
ncbi:MAG: nitroreductase/quinone reductase family protein [Promethearchaeota archaeon]